MRSSKIISLWIVVLMVIAPASMMLEVSENAEGKEILPVPSFTGAGSGTPGDPYIITNVNQLQEMSLELAVYYELGNDIDASATEGWNAGEGFIPIGTLFSVFQGSLDGKNFTIYDLYCNRPAQDYQGLFGCVDNGGKVTNLTMEDAYVGGDEYSGGIVGRFDIGELAYLTFHGEVRGTFRINGGMVGTMNGNGYMHHCTAYADVFTDNQAGILVGRIDNALARVENCSAYGTVHANGNVGGLASRSIGTVKNCTTGGSVHAVGNYAAGLLSSINGGVVEDCYSTASATSDNVAGGLIGAQFSGDVYRCYSSGLVTCNVTLNDGGLIGTQSLGACVDSFWDTETSGYVTSDGGIGLTTANSMLAASYTNWDFTNTWWMVNGNTRPFLQIEHNTTIRNSHQLQLMNMNLTWNYTVANDIDLSGIVDPAQMWGTNVSSGAGFYPIGWGAGANSFTGSFDGNGHLISGLYMKRGGTWKGLFGYVDTGAKITNVTLLNANVTGGQYTGMLVGLFQSTVPASLNVMSNCHAHGFVNGTSDTGGLIGQATYARIDNCSAIGELTTNTILIANNYGGLVGEQDWGVINNSYAIVEVTGNSNVGGFAGYISGAVVNCYSTGYLAGDASIGGFLGSNSGGTTINCFWDNETSGRTWSAGPEQDNYTADLLQQATYTDWDFTNAWWMADGDTRPFLRVEHNTRVWGSHQLQLMAMNLTADYTLANDIQMDILDAAHMWGTNTSQGKGFLPIGNLTDWFTGSFEGNDFAINDLYINRSTTDYVGLFGYTDTSTISNCTMTNANVTGSGFVGALAGWNGLGSFTNCDVQGNVVGVDNVGGMFGVNFGTVMYCNAQGNVTGTANNIGGLISNNYGSIVNCTTVVNTTGTDNYVGGLIGYNGGGTVTGSMTLGDTVGNVYVGGLIGENLNGDIDNCHVHCNVTGDSYVGGLVGNNIDSTVNNSTTNATVNGTTSNHCGGLIGRASGGAIGNSFSIGTTMGTGQYTGGLIGLLTNGATVDNCTSYGDTIGYGMQTGGLIGYSSGGDITYSQSFGNTRGYERDTGGLIGYHSGNVRIFNCSSHGNTTSTNTGLADYVGGLIGRVIAGTIENCTTYGYTNGSDDSVGGLMGYNMGQVFNSSAYGPTKGGFTDLGGLIGYNSGAITNCHSHGFTNGTFSQVGGLIGDNDGGTIINCTSHGDTRGDNTYVGGLIGDNDGHVTNCSAFGNTTGSNNYVGGLMGRHMIRNVTNCHSYGITDNTGQYTGGLIGTAGGVVTNCTSQGNVTGSNDFVGGFVGSHQIGTISKSYSTGNTTGTGNAVGGFAGLVSATIENCYAWGNASGLIAVGGFAGSSGGTLTNSYSTGNASGTGNVGGFVGNNAGGVNSCFWDNETSGWTTSDGGFGNTTKEMMQQATFVNWNFTNIWGMHEANTYPFLLPFGIPPLPSADLNITIEASPTFVGVNQLLQYYVNVTNNGLDNAGLVNATIFGQDEVIENITHNGTDAFMWGYNLTWNVGTLLSGESAWLLLNATVMNASAGLILDSEANVTSVTPEADWSDNNDTVQVRVNTPPIAQDDFNVTDEDTILNVAAPGVFANDTEPDAGLGDFFVLDSFQNPSIYGAAVTVNADGSFTYDPTGAAALQALAVGENIADSFNYTIVDTFGNISTATVSITVTGVNDAPVANNDTATFAEDSGANTINVLDNDTDIDGDDLTITVVTQGAHGTVTIIDVNKNVTYEPDANWFGEDFFNYTISDGNGGTDTATVNITVTSVNDAPVASNDTATFAEDSGANTINVLVNDTDIDGDDLTITVVSQGANGTVTIIDAGKNVTYEPDADFAGTDTFTYTIHDGNNGTDTATVTVNVTPMNDPPVAVDDATTVNEDSGANAIDVLANDNDPDASDTLTIDSVTQPEHGTVVIAVGGLELTYQPDTNYTGLDSFTYTIDDGNGVFDTATVAVTVTNANDQPLAVDDAATVNEDSGSNTIDVAANDLDGDGDTLTITTVTQGTHGTVTITGSGANISYQPDANFFGSDTFTYTVSDGNGGTDAATVTVTVRNVNDPPVMHTSTAPDGLEGQAYSLTMNATDIDGDSLTYVGLSNAAWLNINSNGVLNGTPTPGTFWVDVTVTDGNGGFDSVNLTFVIDPDMDGDGTTDSEDDDRDGDGAVNTEDAFPDDSSEDTDTDGDGIGNNEDPDDDNDGVGDDDDPEPLNPDVTGTDGGIGEYWWIIMIFVVVIIAALAFFFLKVGRAPPKIEDEMQELADDEEELEDAEDEPVVEDSVEDITEETLTHDDE